MKKKKGSNEQPMDIAPEPTVMTCAAARNHCSRKRVEDEDVEDEDVEDEDVEDETVIRTEDQVIENEVVMEDEAVVVVNYVEVGNNEEDQVEEDQVEEDQVEEDQVVEDQVEEDQAALRQLPASLQLESAEKAAFNLSVGWDNFQMKVTSAHHSRDNKNKIIMFAVPYAVVHRTPSLHLDDVVKQAARSLPPTAFLPTRDSIRVLFYRGAHIVRRILSTRFSFFEQLQPYIKSK